jgi:hypothetical protein
MKVYVLVVESHTKNLSLNLGVYTSIKELMQAQNAAEEEGWVDDDDSYFVFETYNLDAEPREF